MIIDFKSGFISNQNLVVLDLEDQLYYHQTFAFKRDSEFVDLFNYHIGVMEKSGVLKHIQNVWIPKTGFATASDSQSEAVVLGFENVAFPFLVVIVGAGIALTLSCFERCFPKRRSVFFKKPSKAK